MQQECGNLIDKILSFLNNNIYVKEIVEYKKDVNFADKTYDYSFDCRLIFENCDINIKIAIPHDWEIKLMDFYILDKDFPFIPHMESSGKLCLFELEGCLIDDDFEGVLQELIERAKQVVLDGLNKRNFEDFIKEFELYWFQQENLGAAKIICPNEKKTTILKYIINNEKRKGESSIDFQKRKRQQEIILFEHSEQLQGYKSKNGMQKNALYYPIISEQCVYPPDPRKPLSVDYISELLLKGTLKELRKLRTKLSGDKIIILEIQQPNGIHNLIGIQIAGDKWAGDRLISCDIIKPIYIKRIEKEYLMGRVGETLLNNKKILLIGCGSIGGYITDLLVKAGANRIMLVDNDKLNEENVFRHILGMQYTSMYKSVALAEFYKQNIPGVKIDTHVSTIQDAIEEEEICLETYDIVISAIGNHNVNLWLNKYVYKNKIDIPVYYAWNEVYGIGNHAAYIARKNTGCYRCFFARDEFSGELFDRNAFCERGQAVVNSDARCGSSYIPYDVAVSEKTAIMCVSLIMKTERGEVTDNMVISLKGDKVYFEKMGLKTSVKYNKQKDNIAFFKGVDFKNEKCTLCG